MVLYGVGLNRLVTALKAERAVIVLVPELGGLAMAFGGLLVRARSLVMTVCSVARALAFCLTPARVPRNRNGGWRPQRQDTARLGQHAIKVSAPVGSDLFTALGRPRLWRCSPCPPQNRQAVDK